MKCVGAEDGQKQCQRCKRANVEFVIPLSVAIPLFTKPAAPLVAYLKSTGEAASLAQSAFLPPSISPPTYLLNSRLSEASKMLRRLEKGLNSAKLKTQPAEPGMSAPYSPPQAHNLPHEAIYSAASPAEAAFAAAPQYKPLEQLPPLNSSSRQLPSINSPSRQLPLPLPSSTYLSSATSAHPMDVDEDDDPDKSDTPPYPAKLIKQTQRNSFFRIILNSEEAPISTSSPTNRGSPYTPPQSNAAAVNPPIPDPISAGIITEADASVLFDALFLRLNPFINLFDPQLHTHDYVRNRSPFLFSTLITAAAKFFKRDAHKACQKLANTLAFRAFSEAWKSVEVVQAFACLTYWRDSEDNVSLRVSPPFRFI